MFSTSRKGWSWSALILSCVLGASGCAHDPTTTSPPPEAKAVKVEETAAVKPANSEPTAAAKSARAATNYATMNPVSLAFDQSSVKLTNESKFILEQIAERAKKEKSLTITGFCDQRQIGNAKAAAIARATAVKKELVRLGVSAKAIRVRYNTEAANKHAADIKF